MQYTRFYLVVVLTLLWCLSTAHAALVEGQLLTASYGRYEEGFIHPSTAIQLNGGRFRTMASTNGLFTFTDVPSGKYILEVKSPQFTFYKIHLHVSSTGEVMAFPFSVGGDWANTHIAMPYPLMLRPRPSPSQFFSPESLKVVRWFSNPLLLMTGFCILMLIALPTLVAHLDPETLQSLQCFSDHPSLSEQQQQQDLHLHVGYGNKVHASPSVGMPTSAMFPSRLRHEHGHAARSPCQSQSLPCASYDTRAMSGALPTIFESQSPPNHHSATEATKSQSSMVFKKKQ
ncbi:hypothetical protein BGZ73_000445 [Actinomortierella ambigua]|nr:hypothetical protein BGZ73_000445 [Actinomortierella ambigua]